MPEERKIEDLSDGELMGLTSYPAMKELDRRVIAAQQPLKPLTNEQVIMRALAQLIATKHAPVSLRALRDELRTRGGE